MTGIGLVTAAGVGMPENLAQFRARANGIRPVTRYPLPGPKVKTSFAGLLPEVPLATLEPELAGQLDNDDLKHDYVKAACLATLEALRDAGAVDRVRAAPARTGMFVGSSLGNYLNVSELVKDYFLKELYKITSLIHGMNSYLPSRLAALFGAAGPCVFVSSSCTSSANALLQAVTMIDAGIIDRAIVCGVDVCLETGTFHLWNKIRVLSQRNDDPATACRPYCATRDGIVVAEAAGCFVVERRSHAVRPEYATIEGIGFANGSPDFFKPSHPHLVTSAGAALANACAAPADVDLVIGSASGSPHCDHIETVALRDVLGDRAAEVPVFSFKSHLGSTFGSQAVTEGALALGCFRANEVPQVRNIFAPDPRVRAHCYYDHRAYAGATLGRMLFLNHGFAGNHMAIVYGK